MSRKNFEAIANAISEASTCDNTEELLAVLSTELMRHFKEENALFNEAKFLKACGI
jgi:hemerythrin